MNPGISEVLQKFCFPRKANKKILYRKCNLSFGLPEVIKKDRSRDYIHCHCLIQKSCSINSHIQDEMSL